MAEFGLLGDILPTVYAHLVPKQRWKTSPQVALPLAPDAETSTLSKVPSSKVLTCLCTGSARVFPKNCVKVLAPSETQAA
jgi:hypothetical protein